MKTQQLFRKDIEPRCAYCAHATPLSDDRFTCRRCGVVSGNYHCRRFRYDPLRRTPPRPAQLRGSFCAEDFALLCGEAEGEA